MAVTHIPYWWRANPAYKNKVRTAAMDELDYRLVDLLQREGRATQLELSRAVGLSQPAVAERIRKLEERGVKIGRAHV